MRKGCRVSRFKVLAKGNAGHVSHASFSTPRKDQETMKLSARARSKWMCQTLLANPSTPTNPRGLGNDPVIGMVGVAVVAPTVKILMSSVLQLCIHSRFGSFQAVTGQTGGLDPSLQNSACLNFFGPPPYVFIYRLRFAVLRPPATYATPSIPTSRNRLICWRLGVV